MQKMYVKVTDLDGTSRTREVFIIRHWGDVDGRHIALHTDGVYGYKDHSPIQHEQELDIITDPLHRRAATFWWESVGKELSSEHYANLQTERERLLKEGLPEVVDGSVSELDAAVYVRQPEGTKGKKDLSKPGTWPEWFDYRPDWWGYASAITIQGYIYALVQLEEEEQGAGSREQGVASGDGEEAGGKGSNF